jgi:hypothetical protein
MTQESEYEELAMAYDENNVFAKMLRGDIPCHKLYEDADTLAFLDIMPRSEGHTLVITKEKARDLFDISPSGLAGFAIRNGNAAAVTLIDTVVFSDESHIRNLALWAHEIHHVQQYEDWGIAGFATRYAFNWQDVEAEASARARSFIAWYKERTGQN